MNFGTNNFKWGIKVFLIILWAMLTIVTCAGVWNYVADAFVRWCSVALMAFNCVALGVSIYKSIKEE